MSTIGAAVAAAATSWRTPIDVGTAIYVVVKFYVEFVIVVVDVSIVYVDCQHTALMMMTTTFVR